MKLKTELTNEQPFGRHVHWKETGDLYHDAAYAHALVMAMNAIRKEQRWSPKFPGMWQLEVHERADELMSQWGYTED